MTRNAINETCLQDAAEIARESVNYKTLTHAELATAESNALRRLIDTADAKLDWTGFRNDLLAIRFEKNRRSNWL